MSIQTACLVPSQLQALLDSQLSAAEQSDLVRHLDGCEGCQQAMQNLANGGKPWTDPVLQLDSDRPAVESAFWPTVAHLNRVGPTPLPPESVTVPAPDHPATASELALDFLAPPEEPGTLGRLERFHVLRVVGRGGMGMVLEALDACLQRKVAIKVMDPQLARDETSRKRFCREARAAAAVVHENVVTIHQVDTDEKHDLPYLVMQYVAGESLQELLDRKGALPVADIVSIGQQIAQGLAAAHSQGLIHRDIKPANVLLDSRSEVRSSKTEVKDGQRNATANRRRTGDFGIVVKITDFGLARTGMDIRLTQTGFVAGTPLYMAPEQARGEELDQRTDLFSLGGVLYAMCTGQPPFEASTPYLVLRRVTDEQPRPIEEINPDVPDWLSDVIDRLLAKNPDDRLQSAAELSEILGQHLQEVQKAARPTPVTSNLLKLRTGRTPVVVRGLRWWQAVLVGAGTFALLQAGMVLSERMGWTHLFTTHGGAVGTESPGPAARVTLPSNAGPVWSVAFAPDGKTLAMGLDDGAVKLWNPANSQVIRTLHAHQGPVWSLAYSPDGAYLVTSSDDGAAKLWDMGADKEPLLLEHQTPVRAIAFSSDNRTLATGTRKGSIRLWDARTGKEMVTSIKGHRGLIMSLAFSPNGKTLASASSDKRVKLWDVKTGQEKLTLPGQVGSVYAVAFSPDGKTLASGGWDRTVRLWDADTGNVLAEMTGHAGDVWSLAFSPDSRLLASASEDHKVKLWSVTDHKEVASFKGHTGSLHTATFAPDGRTVASGGRDGIVNLWDVPAAP
jgi:eukaryotic-like serine/threonine-protein kinase